MCWLGYLKRSRFHPGRSTVNVINIVALLLLLWCIWSTFAAYLVLVSIGALPRFTIKNSHSTDFTIINKTHINPNQKMFLGLLALTMVSRVRSAVETDIILTSLFTVPYTLFDVLIEFSTSITPIEPAFVAVTD